MRHHHAAHHHAANLSRQRRRRRRIAAVVAGVTLLLGGLAAVSVQAALPRLPTADAIEVAKAAHRLTLLREGKPIRSYQVALGAEPALPKRAAGDRRTPEGRYTIDRHVGNSAFHLALHISYPNAEDRARAAARGVAPGGDIEIHGLKRDAGWIGELHRLVDWTNGCIAVTNAEIEEIAAAVPDGTPITIRP